MPDFKDQTASVSIPTTKSVSKNYKQFSVIHVTSDLKLFFSSLSLSLSFWILKDWSWSITEFKHCWYRRNTETYKEWWQINASDLHIIIHKMGKHCLLCMHSVHICIAALIRKSNPESDFTGQYTVNHGVLHTGLFTLQIFQREWSTLAISVEKV